MLSTEQTLTRVLQIVHALGESDAAIYNAVSKAPDEWKNVVGPIHQLYFLEQDLRRTLAEEAAARAGSRSAFLAARSICQSAIHTQSHRPAAQGAWTDDDGKQCVCDGMRGFRLNSPFILPQAKNPAPGSVRFDLAAVIAPLRNNARSLSLPTAEEVRESIKVQRAEQKAKKHRKGETFRAYFDFGPGFPRVNAQYLLDFLQLFPKDLEAFASAERPLLTPLYFKSPAGEGVLCPCRKTEMV